MIPAACAGSSVMVDAVGLEVDALRVVVADALGWVLAVEVLTVGVTDALGWVLAVEVLTVGVTDALGWMLGVEVLTVGVTDVPGRLKVTVQLPNPSPSRPSVTLTLVTSVVLAGLS
jgi:hypothetical protein